MLTLTASVGLSSAALAWSTPILSRSMAILMLLSEPCMRAVVNGEQGVLVVNLTTAPDVLLMSASFCPCARIKEDTAKVET